ncbi:tRNA 2-selenouridine synthase [Cytobacillus eiseniae]|uniref:tRNA 2-selenouridine synthase n=1 Tax=Cytobacillus eiseniae TaxID=762947 RepID=A0ABS4RG24_9BACI|nr:tRNA 2-selenouridine(34) synthase MnmH [Cytobacillus eiseniae]MBP2241846.1 tRNA 2-selenouridine synthase [Cytobacillus eiseniae]
MKEITVGELLQLKNAIPIDVRSPVEFKEFCIPGAVNIPLFTDEERAVIGTIYKQEGSDAAKWKAMEVVSPKLPTLLGEIKEISANGMQPIIYCWRGGMRSKAVATFISFSGLSIPRLVGGYRAYRQYILEQIPAMLPEKAITLHGMTGVGKTDILKGLSDKGFPVIDLEALAGHRGSIFGTYGLFTGNNQKTFDALLFQSLMGMQESPYFLIEAESKRIGKVVIPEALLLKKQQGMNIQLQSSLQSRIERIYSDYVFPYLQEEWFHNKVIERLVYIKKRLKDYDLIFRLDEAVNQENYHLVIKILLEEYYDPRYAHKKMEYTEPFHFINNAEHIESTMNEIILLIEKNFLNRQI